MVAHTCNPSIQEAEAGDHKVEVILGYIKKEKEARIRGMAWWQECLLCKCEDTSSNPQHPHKKLGYRAGHSGERFNSSTWDAETGGSL